MINKSEKIPIKIHKNEIIRKKKLNVFFFNENKSFKLR